MECDELDEMLLELVSQQGQNWESIALEFKEMAEELDEGDEFKEQAEQDFTAEYFQNRYKQLEKAKGKGQTAPAAGAAGVAKNRVSNDLRAETMKHFGTDNLDEIF